MVGAGPLLTSAAAAEAAAGVAASSGFRDIGCGTRSSVSSEQLAFGKVPSQAEAEFALAALKGALKSCKPPSHMHKEQAVDKTTTCSCLEIETISEEQVSNVLENAPVNVANNSSQPMYANSFQSQGLNEVQNALCNPSIEKMVLSLSTDTEVWNAIMKNEVVTELKHHLFPEFKLNSGIAEIQGKPHNRAPAEGEALWL